MQVVAIEEDFAAKCAVHITNRIGKVAQLVLADNEIPSDMHLAHGIWQCGELIAFEVQGALHHTVAKVMRQRGEAVATQYQIATSENMSGIWVMPR